MFSAQIWRTATAEDSANGLQAAAYQFNVTGIVLNQHVTATQAFRGDTGSAGARHRVEYPVAFVGAGQQDAFKQRERLLRGMLPIAARVAQPFTAAANRQPPDICAEPPVVERLCRVAVEGMPFRIAVARRPDKSFGGIGKTDAEEIRHRIRLLPNDIVQNPEADVLHQFADTVDVVVSADEP